MTTRQDRPPTGTRDTREVIEDHLALRIEGDLEADIERNYHPDVVLLQGTGILHGHDGVRDSAAQLDEYLGPDARFRIRTLYTSGRHGFIEWWGEADGRVVCDGADSFVVEEGRIVAQTIHYTVEDDPT